MGIDNTTTPDEVQAAADSQQSAPAPQPSPAPQSTPTPGVTAVPVASATSAQPGTVSNPTPTNQQPQPSPSATVSNPAPAQHPAVQKASVLREMAQTLAGGPKYSTTVDPKTGAITRTEVPLSNKAIWGALVLEAISGSLTGLAQRGPNAIAQAGVAGLKQGEQQFQQRQAAEQQQTQEQQQNFQNQNAALAAKASLYETNSRTLLNTAQAQNLGVNAVKDLIAINRASGVLDVDPALLENSGVPMTEAELSDALRNGSINSTSHLGPVAGYTIGPDGQIQTTHLIIKDTGQKIPISQAQWDTYANAGIPGFPKDFKVGDGLSIPLRFVASANEQLGERTLTDHKLDDLRGALDGTPWASKVPDKIDFSKPDVARAMTALARYQSHDATNAADPYLALQQMGAAKRNPDGTLQPNPDAKYADTIAQAMGGWSLLEAAHNQIEANRKSAADFAVIDSADKAQAVIAAPKRFTPEQVQSAKNFLALSNAQGARKAADDARARAIAEGTDVQMMYRFGKNPVTGEQLSLSNAPDSMLVSSSGQVIPQDLVSTYKPSAQEKQTADTARQVLAISAYLQSQIQKNPALAGPLSGRSKAGLAKLGYGDAQAQKFLDDVSFLQTAATKMHTSRFSNQILDKMGSLIGPQMNANQFTGALSSINDIASRYADEDKLRTVGEYKQTAPANPNPQGGRQVQIPAGAEIGRDGKGNVIGYRLNGQFVSLGGNQ